MTLEGYSYLGLGTVVERSLTQAAVALQYHEGSAGGDSNDIDTGLDRFGRITRQLWWDSGDSTAAVDFHYGYDESSNRLYREDKTNDSITVNFGELYGYDGLNQLIDFGRGELNETYTGLDTTTRSQEWTPDALGNFNSVTTDTTTVNRTHDGRNQLLTVGSSTLTYDDAGSMTTDETGRTFTYDAWNRLMSSTASSVTVNKEYDALNRRVVDGAKTLLYSDHWQVLEERDGSSTVTSNVWSPVYVDAILARDTFVSGSLNARFYALADANYNVVALVDTAGVVQERYVYDPYGTWTKLAAAYAAYTGTDRQWLNLHQGGRWDVATAMYHFRHRDLSASLMRWEKMDPIGLAGADSNLNRSYGNNSLNSSDWSGLMSLIGCSLQMAVICAEGATGVIGKATAGGVLGAGIVTVGAMAVVGVSFWQLYIQAGKIAPGAVATALVTEVIAGTEAATELGPLLPPVDVDVDVIVRPRRRDSVCCLEEVFTSPVKPGVKTCIYRCKRDKGGTTAPIWVDVPEHWPCPMDIDQWVPKIALPVSPNQPPPAWWVPAMPCAEHPRFPNWPRVS